MTPEELRSLVTKINVWKRGDTRAPHKPLLLLLALGRCAVGKDRRIPFSQVEVDLGRLLREFGRPSSKVAPQYPFWRLQNDGLWVVDSDHPMQSRKGKDDPKVTELRRANARGAFPEPIHDLLRRDPALVHEVAQAVLEEHFPESLWDELLSAVGLERRTGVDRRQRSADFRLEVLRAYQRRCAVCGFDLRVGDVLVGLEAAHIRWHCYQGPDEVSNGLSLCALHHKLFDKGAFTLGASLELVASQDLAGDEEALDRWVLRHHGAPIRPPQQDAYLPQPEYLAWHRREVFREPAIA